MRDKYENTGETHPAELRMSSLLRWADRHPGRTDEPFYLCLTRRTLFQTNAETIMGMDKNHPAGVKDLDSTL